jgi:hypothetical protein
MIGFISSLVRISLNYNQYNAIADLHTFQFTVAHTLGFSVFTSHVLATGLNTEASTSHHYEVVLPFIAQSPWNLGTQLKTLLDSSQVPFLYSLISPQHRPHRKRVMCQTASSFVCYQRWEWRGLQRKHSPLYCCLI